MTKTWIISSTDSSPGSGRAAAASPKSRYAKRRVHSVFNLKAANPVSQRERYDALLACDDLPESVSAMLVHLGACLGGRIPECATCRDVQAIRPGHAGYVRCPACFEVPRILP